MAGVPYKLSSVLFGHSLDVRAIAVTPDNIIISGSRDKTAKCWRPNGINTGYSEFNSFKSHTNFISSVCVLPPSNNFKSGLVLTGGNDNIICAYTLDNSSPIFTLKEHSNTVCSLVIGNDTDSLLSSSWDCTAKLWLLGSSSKAQVTFTGHQAAVWAVIQLRNGNIVTGGADKDIIIWMKNGSKLKTLTGHKDCVRGLTVLNDEFFLSAANDAAIKQWSVEGECVNTFYGHTNYIYSICLNKHNGEDCFLTSGEDRTVRFWQNGENTQIITLPAQSVWCVSCLNNGDIVTGSSDGVVRIFTQDPKRVADDVMLKTFEEEVNGMDAASSQEIGGVKISDLPGREVLYEPGRTDGQTKLVREGSNVQCYSWSASDFQWKKIGDVLGAAGGTQASSGKTLYEGKEYDFVFSVDIEDGKPPLKLPYNCNENPWLAAQTFIHKNNLSQTFLDQVAQFIIKNSGVSNQIAQTNAEPDFADPFTGASRYKPTTETVSTSSFGNNADPFTGSSSYKTGTNSSSEPDLNDQKHCYFPQRSYLRFDQGNISLILDKLLDFNTKVENNHQIEEELIRKFVNVATGETIGSEYLAILLKLLNWPNNMIFPVLDVIRLAIRYSKNNAILCSEENEPVFVNVLKTFVNPECTVIANQMLSLRILSNMFNFSNGEKLLNENKEYFLSNVIRLGPSIKNKNVQIAATSLILNYTIYFIKENNYSMLESISTISAKLLHQLLDYEAIFRLFVSIGTILFESEDSVRLKCARPLLSEETFVKKLEEICNLTGVGNLSETAVFKMVTCASQVSLLLKQ